MMSKKSKKRVIKDYEKLCQDLKNLLVETYPGGIAEHIKPFTDVHGKLFYAVTLETNENILLIRLPFKMVNVKDEDEDEEKPEEANEDIFEELTLDELDEDEYIIQDEE
jgi:hypothetical protein